MPLFGTLRTMPLRDLLLWIAQGERTGTLQVERDRVSRWIVFRGGAIVSCSSDAPPERLGHFLLAQGRIREEQLREALAAQETSKRPLGAIFVEMGALSEAELTRHLRAQAEESVLALFDWPEAVFRYHEDVREDIGFPVRLDVGEMVSRGEERLAELTRIREVFPDHGVVLRHGRRQPPEAVLQSPMAGQLYAAIDGQRTIAEILLHVHGSEFMVTRFLCELHRAGFLDIVDVPAPAPAADEGEPVLAGATAATARASVDPVELLNRAAPSAAPGPAPSRTAAPAVPAAGPAVATATPPAAVPDSAEDGTRDAEPPRVAEAAETTPSTSAPPAGTETATAGQPVVPPPAVDADVDVAPAEALDWAAEPIDEHSEILDIPDVFAESSDVEAVEDSVAYQVDRKLERIREDLRNGRYEEALVELDELYRRFPDDDALRRLMAEAEASFKDQAYRHYVPAHMVPSLKIPIEQIESENLSPTEFFLLSRIDGSWDVKSIIQIAPIREVEALLTLKRLRERGVIELRDPTASH